MPQDPTATCDVAVIGGGVIGLSIAWRAAQRGCSVRLYERGELGGGASRVAAGMLAPVTEADPGERALLELGLRSARMWPSFAAELAETAACDLSLRRCGALVIARDDDEARALERELALRLAMGLDVERLLPTAARKREPALTPSVRLALAVASDQAVDPRAMVVALAEASRRAGVALYTHANVERISCERAKIRGLQLAGGEIVAARAVVIASGAWTGALDGLPEAARFALRPVKGQIMRLRDPAGPGLLERIVRFDGGYLVPRGDGRYVLGATMEERGFDTSVTAGGLYELLRDAGEVVPGIHELIVEETAAGLRPATPDNAPVLGRSDALEGLHWATGHHRNGILLAPVTAELVAAELDGREAVPASFAARRLEKVAA